MSPSSSMITISDIFTPSRGGRPRSIHDLDRDIEHVTGAALGPDVRGPLGIRLDLAPQPEDLHVDRAVVDLRAVEPREVEQLIAREDAPRRRAECLQQAELAV